MLCNALIMYKFDIQELVAIIYQLNGVYFYTPATGDDIKLYQLKSFAHSIKRSKINFNYTTIVHQGAMDSCFFIDGNCLQMHTLITLT